VAKIVCCVNIFHLTWPTSSSYLVKARCSQLLHNIEMYYLQQTIWRLNWDTVNWNMVYLAELLIVMTVWLKIVRILARNMARTRTHAFRWRHVFCVSLFHSRKVTMLCSRCAGALSCWNTKNHLRTTCACLTVVIIIIITMKSYV